MTTLTDLFGLKGHRALVTGASSGFGVEFAEALAIAGADVALVARREERLRRLATRLEETYAVRTAVVSADLSVLDSLGGVVDRCEQALGPVDILVNNAGTVAAKRAEKLTLAEWSRTIDLNLSASFRLCQEVARRLFERRAPGRIVNIGSVLGTVGSAVFPLASYVASKAALLNLTRQLAIEWADRGVTVNALAPAWFPTELTASGLQKIENRKRMEVFTPMGRLGRPEEVRAALLFLVSPAASYVTGSTVFVDGGYTAW